MKVSVLNLRNQFQQKNASVPTVPGCYCFWFDKQGMQKILKPLESVCTRKLQKKVIDGKDCYALYFGIAKNLKDRAKWHICQHHSMSSVKSGYLSTLRQTLSALLRLNMSVSEKSVNTFLDEHCYFEYFGKKTLDESRACEENELCKNYYPLNIQHNKCVEKQTINSLKHIRKEYRK